MIDEKLIADLEAVEDPGSVMAELEHRFPGRMAIGTSGQLTGCALIDMAARAGLKPRVFTIDTLRLFPETYELFERLETRYGIRIERFSPKPEELEPMLREHGEFLFFDGREKQELCCRVRKVLPNARALETVDAWVTGLRADQSRSRAGAARFQIIDQPGPGGPRRILKAAPLAAWTEARLREYLAARDVPVHPLLDRKLPGDWYYESLGCVICTSPIGPYEPRRAGRWRWFNAQDHNKECGIHQMESRKS